MNDTDSPLLRLPAELRNYIYELSTVPSSGVHILGPPPEWVTSEVGIQPSITRTCSQIRREALPIFYSSTVFHIIPDDTGYPYPDRFLLAIGRANCAMMKHILYSVESGLMLDSRAQIAACAEVELKRFFGKKCVGMASVMNEHMTNLPVYLQDYIRDYMGWPRVTGTGMEGGVPNNGTLRDDHDESVESLLSQRYRVWLV
jgi:hypothetical protein